MYAVIRTGGKQYRVSPGEIVNIEKIVAAAPSEDAAGSVEFRDVLAVSSGDLSLARPVNARVTGIVLGDGRGDKVLVFHFKRKKQYKKLRGHRQAFTAVRIESVEADGKTYTQAN